MLFLAKIYNSDESRYKKVAELLLFDCRFLILTLRLKTAIVAANFDSAQNGVVEKSVSGRFESCNSELLLGKPKT